MLEATLEVIRAGIVEGIQDMGAAGITCSTSEMSAKGNCGMKIDLDKVPLRDKDMSAYEIMLSESQERMLVVVKKGCEDEAVSIFEKWDLNCVRIGEVTDGKMIEVHHKGEKVAEVPAEELVLGGGAPVYVREKSEPAYLNSKRSFSFSALEVPDDLNLVLERLLSSPNIAGKKWVYTQYDSQVGANTSMLPGGDASVVRIKNSRKAIAMKVDCNSRYVYLNPYKGAMIAVCECARNVACTGAVPLAITNCLNFGNPYNPEVYYQFSEAVRGIGDACKVLDTPVTGGNVSFYNQSKEYAVYPTPTIGMIGLLEDVDLAVGSGFRNPGDDIILLGDFRPSFGGSEYMNRIFGLTEGDSPDIDPEGELNLMRLLNRLASLKLLNSAHDLSDGGLAVALAECCITGGIEEMGCNVEFASDAGRNDLKLFGESQGCIIISCPCNNSGNVFRIAEDMGVKSALIGKTTSDSTISIGGLIGFSSSKAREAYYGSIPGLMRSEHQQP